MKEFILFSQAAQIIEASLFHFGYRNFRQNNNCRNWVVAGEIFTYYLYRIIKKYKTLEQKSAEKYPATTPPTKENTLQCFLLNIVGVLTLRKGLHCCKLRKVFLFLA
jgi:hypothetical protein